METKPKRANITRATEDEVLGLFNHQCSICGAPKPHLHHIDENPSNDDSLNLLPLCPNHHLTDQHDPTRAIEIGRLKLFRQYRDPSILKPQFQPLYKRMSFLEQITEDAGGLYLNDESDRLLRFIYVLEMGSFYELEIRKLIKWLAREWYGVLASLEAGQTPNNQDKHIQMYREELRRVRPEVFSLVIEMLRFQNWPDLKV